MNVVFSSSDLYTKCTGIAMYSLLKNNIDLYELNIYVITTDMTETNKSIIKEMCDSYGRQVIFIDGNEALSRAKKEMDLLDFKGGLNTYARALANRILPEDIDKALFLDSDLLINGSLKPLDDLDLGDNIVAGVCEVSVLIRNLCYEDSTLLEKCKNYINYGVALFSLANWRKHNGDERIRQCIANAEAPFRVAEQSILNLAFKDYTLKLPLKYNYSTYLHGIPYEKMSKWYQRRRVFSEDEYCEAEKAPIIIHFIGDYFNRPWYENNICRYKEVYMNYYGESPWSECDLDKKPENISRVFRMYYCLLIFLRKNKFDTAYFKARYVYVQWLREHVTDLDGRVKRTTE